MKKRLLSLLLVVCMSLTIFPMEALALTMQDIQKMTNKEKLELLRNPFEDVSEKDWFYDAIQYVRINGIFNGVSETAFDPQGTLTRSMFVTVLGRMAGVDKENYEGQSVFADVPADQYYAPYVAWAYKHGITTGTSETTFSPNAPVSRQQMATFFVRYFDAFGISYDTGIKVESTPADLYLVADWAKAAVLKLWETGLLNGDGVSFDPASNATRAETATLCMRTDGAVEVWYKEPGEPSGRVAIDPKKIKLNYATTESVYFFDDEGKCFDEISTWTDSPLGHMPPVEKYSRPGKILVGYYLDKEYTEPFYAENPINNDTFVYAKYQDMQDDTVLNLTTFTQMDQDPDLTFEIERVSGNTSARNAAELIVKDGSEMVELSITGSGDTYTVRAVGGFNEGCTYELQLKDGWIFAGKPDTIRTASFSIAMDEVNNLTMGKDIVYLQDESGDILDVLSAYMNSESPKNTFAYDGDDLDDGDILCVYMGAHPEARAELANDDDPENDIALTEPALYVKVEDVDGDTVTFAPLSEQDQLKLYEIPDVFTFYVDTMPTGAGTVDLETLDISFYETAYGKEEGTLEKAKTKVNEGDFVAFYTDLTDGEDSEVFYGRVTGYANGIITYAASSEEELLNCMDLYSQVDLDGETLIDDALAADLEAQLYAQVEESGFAEEAAYMLADVVAGTDNFNEAITISEFMLADREGRALTRAQVRDLARGGFAIRPNSIKLDVDLIRDGDQLHFNNGVQMAINIEAELELFVSEGTVVIDLAATFVEEVELKPTVKGELTYTEVIIPIPNGVQVTANIDIKNYTAMSFEAEVYTVNESTNQISETIRVTEQLLNFMDIAQEEGLGTEYYDGLEALLQKYSEMVTKETDWVRLVEQEIFTAEVCIAGICIGVETNFVVRADMSIALGSNLEYEVGKRYSFWFRIGLYTPTAGSETTDLIDESFAFRFYVLGKLGVKAGVNAKLYVGIGTGKLASVGIKAEMGPYVKLWGFFIYDYSKYRPAGSPNWTYVNQRHGALCTEFGLYFMLSFEAEALELFEYSYDFLDVEVPILNAGDERYHYNMTYKPEEDEVVVITDSDGELESEVDAKGNHYSITTMQLYDWVRALDYVDLRTGRFGSESLPYDQYKLTITSPYFSVTPSGEVTVRVPEGVRVLGCDLVITYLNGKMPLSNYDMTVTIPLIWTNLSATELKEYHTASVRVDTGNGYETVWTKKLLKGQQYDLPSEAEIKELIGWDDLKYKMPRDGGYEVSKTEDLTLISDSTFNFNIERQEYEITVKGDTDLDGSNDLTRKITAKYGETFDFSSLRDTGAEDEGETYTKFTHVTLTIEDENGAEKEIDLRQPIDLTLAQAIEDDNYTATAHYVDDSVTAVFTFVGVTEEDVTIKLRKGETPSTKAVTEVLRAEDEEGEMDVEGSPLYDRETVGFDVSDITPVLGPIHQGTNYMVTCIEATGERNLVHFDLQGGSPSINPWDKLVGSLLVNLPTEKDVGRIGYDFDGWYTEPKDEDELFHQTGENALSQTVPKQKFDYGLTEGTGNSVPMIPGLDAGLNKPSIEDLATEIPYTIYAQWTPLTFAVELDPNGGRLVAPNGSGTPDDQMIAVFDNAFGESYAQTNGTSVTDKNDDNRYNLKDLEGIAHYGALPSAVNTARVDDPADNVSSVGLTFAGWYCDFDGDGNPFEDGEEVDDETTFTRFSDAQLEDRKLTLVARWKTLVSIPRDYITVSGRNVDYTSYGSTPDISRDTSMQGVYVFTDAPTVEYSFDYPTTGFVNDYRRVNSHEYEERGNIPRVAGQYFTMITRPADDVYEQMEWIYDRSGELHKINKIYGETLTADAVSVKYDIQGAAVVPKVTISGRDSYGDGKILCKVDGDVITYGASYNLSKGSHRLQVCIDEGMNYKATNWVDVGTFEIKENDCTFVYTLTIATGSHDDASTDSEIFVTVGNGKEKHLDEKGNDFQQNSVRAYAVDIPDDIDLRSGKVDVRIRMNDKALTGAWQLGWLQFNFLRQAGTDLTEMGTSARYTYNDWFKGDVTKTFTLTGVGRQLDGEDMGLEYDPYYDKITMDRNVTDNYGKDYDPYLYENSPRMFAYFTAGDILKNDTGEEAPIFDRYIIRTGINSYDIDYSGLKSAMDAYRIHTVYLHYGITFAESKGLAGASGYTAAPVMINIGDLAWK